MSHQRKDAVREGSYYIAVVCLFLLSTAIPLLNMVTVWFLPLPFIILGVLQQNRSTTFMVALFLTILSCFLYIGIVLYLWVSFLTGYFMGRVYREPHTSASQVVLGGMIGNTISVLVSIYIGFSFFNLGISLQKQWAIAWKTTGQLKTLGISEPPPIEMVIPVCILFFMVAMVLLNLWAARRWLSYKGFPGKYLPRFHNWNLPKSFFYVYLISLLWLLMIGEDTDDTMGHYLLSFISILKTLFLLQGLSFFTYLLYINKWKRIWIFLAIPLLFTPVSTIIELIGVIDVGIGLKKKFKDQLKNK